MDPMLIEARYQRAVFRGAEETILRDFQLRYGEMWRSMWDASANVSEEDVQTAEKNADVLIELVKSRIDDIDTAALYAAFGRNLSLEKELELGLELLERPGGLEKLLQWGLIMHYDDEVVAAPPYLAKLLIYLTQRTPSLQYDIREELEPYSNDGATMAFLEGLLVGDFNIELHREFYGEPPRRIKIGRAAIYRSDVGLVVNPAYSSDEVLNAILQIKERRAEALARALSLHGEYEFSKEYRCGLQYLSIDGTAEKSGVIAICPWLSYRRKLWKIHNLILVVEGKRPTPQPQTRIGIIFIKGGEAEVVKPPVKSKLFEYIVDTLYSTGFSVLED